MKKDRLITERLVLRRLRRDDAEPMFRNWDSDIEVAKYTLWVAHEDVEVTKKLGDVVTLFGPYKNIKLIFTSDEKNKIEELEIVEEKQ